MVSSVLWGVSFGIYYFSIVRVIIKNIYCFEIIIHNKMYFASQKIVLCSEYEVNATRK